MGAVANIAKPCTIGGIESAKLLIASTLTCSDHVYYDNTTRLGYGRDTIAVFTSHQTKRHMCVTVHVDDNNIVSFLSRIDECSCVFKNQMSIRRVVILEILSGNIG